MPIYLTKPHAILGAHAPLTMAALLAPLALAAFATMTTSGCSSGSPPPEHTASNAGAIQGGSDDKSHAFAVGVCGGTIGNCELTCSGALIAPNLVVTARHCVDNSPEGIAADCTDAGPDCFTCKTANFGSRLGAPSDYSITTDYSMRQATSGWHSVIRIITPAATGMCGNDIALLILADNVPAAEATPVTPAVQTPITDHTVYSTSETAIGYGLTAPQTTSSPDTSGVRRIKQNIDIACIPDDPKASLDCYKIDPLYKAVVAENEFVAGDGTCQGDSGGSAFEQKSIDDGAPVSLGVLSRGGANDANTQCLGAVYTRLDKWRDLLVSTAETAAQLGRYPVPAWTLPAGSDAGASGSAALGATCVRDGDCHSGLCASPPDAADTTLVCTQSCGSANACPGGFTCGGTPAGCFANTGSGNGSGAVTTTTTTTTTSCAVGVVGDPTNPLRWASFASSLVAMAGLALARRRRAPARR